MKVTMKVNVAVLIKGGMLGEVKLFPAKDPEGTRAQLKAWREAHDYHDEYDTADAQWGVELPELTVDVAVLDKGGVPNAVVVAPANHSKGLRAAHKQWSSDPDFDKEEDGITFFPDMEVGDVLQKYGEAEPHAV